MPAFLSIYLGESCTGSGGVQNPVEFWHAVLAAAAAAAAVMCRLSSAVHTGSVFLRGSTVAERKTFDAAFALSCCARAE